VLTLALLAVSATAAGCTPTQRTATASPAAIASGPVVGPANGTLIVAGGGSLGHEIVQRFLELAGGPDASIVVIPTAGGDTAYAQDWGGADLLRRAGARRVTILHTLDRGEADSEAFVAPLRTARAVWFPGGRQWRLVDSYLGTRTERELHALLERGGVVGGTSAGASIQASYLVRGAREGNHIMMAPGYERGFAFLRGVAVDQHVVPRRRLADLPLVIERHPRLLGIGIDEGTAIVVQGDEFEVIGTSKVFVYGGEDPNDSDGPYVTLDPGGRYDMGARRVLTAVGIDSARLMTDMSVLAADSMEGRRTGTAGSTRARLFLERRFENVGLAPIGNSFRHTFALPARGEQPAQQGINFVGFVRGTVQPGRYIVVTAHYDHLGIGRAVNGDSLYNGADDNASGTAALLAMARWFRDHPPRTSIIFVALDAEEGGLRGARAFVAEPPVPLETVALNVNMDMIGRNDRNELYAAGTHHYQFLARYVEFVAASAPISLRIGHDTPVNPQDDWTTQSDHAAFHAVKIPFLYFGVEDHPDYHQPSDELSGIQPKFYVRAVEAIAEVITAIDQNIENVVRAAGR
jgi:cyanophycinase